MNELKDEFLRLSDKWFNRFASRLEGLTDEEYHWEPVPDCWSIEPDEHGRYNMRWGRVFDEVPPVTTIAWRYTHVIDLLCEERCATYIGVEPEPENIFANGAPPDVRTAGEMLDAAFARWKRYISATDYSKIFDKIGPVGGPLGRATRSTFVLHILDEAIHHGAEIGVLRDLYRAQHDTDPEMTKFLKGEDVDASTVDRLKREQPDLVRTAAATAYWDAIPRLLELGFSPGAEGRTAVHHAAAEGRVYLMKLLLGAGAPHDSLDPVYNVAPIVWAQFFNQTEAEQFLRSLDRS